MTELQTLSPVMRRLFDDVDQAVEPQSQAVKAATAAWQAERSTGALPRTAGIWNRLRPEWVPHAFVVTYAPDRRHLRLIRAGAGAAPCAAVPREEPLAELGNRQLVCRLRRVLDFVVARQEPVVVRHRIWLKGGERAHAELLVAPCAPQTSEQKFFCALALRHEQGAWET